MYKQDRHGIKISFSIAMIVKTTFRKILVCHLDILHEQGSQVSSNFNVCLSCALILADQNNQAL